MNSAKFITMRPPRTLRRLIANAAQVAIIRVRTPVATAITQAKFGHQPPGFGSLLGPWTAKAVAVASEAGVEAFVAVPPQRDRLRARGWHLPDLLASTLAAASPSPAWRALRRIDCAAPRATGCRTAPSFERRRPLWPFGNREGLRGRAVALVDDVVTTGDTLAAAASALTAAGARVVMFAVLADARPGDRRVALGVAKGGAVDRKSLTSQGIQAEATRQPAAPPTRRRAAAH